MVYSNNNKFL